MYREAEGAFQQLAGQWKERFDYFERVTPGQEHVPPVMILVCDNTDVAELVYENVREQSVCAADQYAHFFKHGAGERG